MNYYGVVVGPSRFPEEDYQTQADFRRALRSFLHSAEEEARHAGLTPQQYLLLLMTRGHRSYPAVTVGELADALKLQQSTVSLLVDRAVRRGLLHRVESPVDRRRVEISVTAEGQRLLDEVMIANREEMQTLEGGLFTDSLLRVLRQHHEAGSDG